MGTTSTHCKNSDDGEHKWKVSSKTPTKTQVAVLYQCDHCGETTTIMEAKDG